MRLDLMTLSLDYLAGHYPAELTIRQLALLGVLCDRPGPHRVRDLAATLGVQKPVITRAVYRLAEHDLVMKRRDPEDGRDRIITPTSVGLAMRDAMELLASRRMVRR